MKEDMARNQATTEMVEDRKHWHVMIRAGTLSTECRGGKLRRREKKTSTQFQFVSYKIITLEVNQLMDPRTGAVLLL